MAKLYILIGLPGSGKSTWAELNKNKLFSEILSSDRYREILCGNENDQTKNGMVFKLLYNDMVALLEDGVDVCLDATNVNLKDRKRVFSKIQSIPGVEKIALVFSPDLELSKSRNRIRDRVVPEGVIDRMYERFSFPTYEEGFDVIQVLDKY